MSSPRLKPALALGAAALVFLLVVPRASAEEKADAVTARLAWRQSPGGEQCLDAAALERAVNRRWQRAVFVDRMDADIVLGGTVGRTSHGDWLARIELHRGDGTSLGSRDLSTAARDCSSLDDSIALAVGLMLDVSRRQIAEEREHPAEPRAVVAGSGISVPTETLPARARWRSATSLGVETAVGLLPEPALAGRFGVALDPPRFFHTEFAAELWANVRADDAQGARFSLWTAELSLCPLGTSPGLFEFYGCVAQRFGEIRAAAFGFAQNRNAAEPLWTLGARAVGSFRIATHFALRMSGGADVPLVRYRFVYDDARDRAHAVYRMPVVSGGLSFGLAVTF